MVDVAYPTDLIELGDHQRYARLCHQGERLPAFHVRLDPPPTPDLVVRDLLAATSAACTAAMPKALHIREDTLRAALIELDQFVLRHPLARYWGAGTRSSSGGMRVKGWRERRQCRLRWSGSGMTI